MGSFIDITGQRFGRLTVLGRYDTRKKKIRWLCKCDCGGTAIVVGGKLRYGETKSCGCIVREGIRPRKTEAQKRLRRIYIGMKQRCLRQDNAAYKYYGQRGVSICQEWIDDFEAFYQWAIANGYSNDLTLDRISSNGNYEPSNCRWITIQDQQRNRRNNVHLTINGETHSIAEWSRLTGVCHSTIALRHKNGWPDVECVYGKHGVKTA